MTTLARRERQPLCDLALGSGRRPPRRCAATGTSPRCSPTCSSASAGRSGRRDHDPAPWPASPSGRWPRRRPGRARRWSRRSASRRCTPYSPAGRRALHPHPGVRRPPRGPPPRPARLGAARAACRGRRRALDPGQPIGLLPRPQPAGSPRRIARSDQPDASARFSKGADPVVVTGPVGRAGACGPSAGSRRSRRASTLRRPCRTPIGARLRPTDGSNRSGYVSGPGDRPRRAACLTLARSAACRSGRRWRRGRRPHRRRRPGRSARRGRRRRRR